MWGRIRALIAKEFVAVWRDKRSRAVIIGPPLIQLMVFGYAATFDVNHVATAIYNEDGSTLSRDLAARFAQSPSFDVIAHINRDGDIPLLLDPRRVALVVHIGQDFGADLLAGRGAPVQLIVDGRASNTALIILNYANTVITDFNQAWVKQNGLPAPPARLVVRAWFNENLQSRWFIVPGIVALLSLVVTVIVTGLSVARERELGTFEQLLVTPLRPLEILVGKAVPGIVIGFVEGLVIVLVAVAWFQVPLRGSLPLLALSLLVYILSVVGIGLMLSAMVRTQQQAILGAFMFIVPTIILSGFATPIANMPLAVQKLTLLFPMRYFLVVVRGSFLEGLPVTLIWSQIWPMALLGVATLGGAAWLFRHRMS